MTKKHAKLSASGSSKWLNCPGSYKAELNYKNTSSKFADEGTLAHEIADLCLSRNHEADFYVGESLKELKINIPSYDKSYIIEKDMTNYVQEYVDYVRSFENQNTILFTEERVDFSNYIPEGFGTMDSAVLDLEKGICHIFDLKYGKGVAVDAFENTQAQLYAIGLYNELGFLDIIKSFTIHIVQPRISNYSSWDINIDDLTKFAEYASERANLALKSEKPPIIPGDKQCQWCLHKGNCKALAKFTEDIISSEFEDLTKEKLNDNNLNNSDLKRILDNKNLIENFLKSVQDNVFSIIESGQDFEGYKIVEGRSIRKWNDEAEDIIITKLGEEAYKKSLIGISEAEKKIGKDEVSLLTIKPMGKPTLVASSDKRKALDYKINDMFEEITEE